MKQIRLLLPLFPAVALLLSVLIFLTSYLGNPSREPLWSCDVSDAGVEAVDAVNIPELTAESGIYSVAIRYRTDAYGMLQIFPGHDLPVWSVQTNNTLLPPYADHISSLIYIAGTGVTFSGLVGSVEAEGNLQILSVDILRRRGLSAAYTALRFFGVLMFLWVIVVFVRRARSTSPQKRRCLIGLVGIVLLGSLGFLMSHIPGGQDADFHIARIAGIADGIAGGEFPVRLYSFFLNDQGYPLGVLYGDAFLYPAAILHLLGCPLWKCYTFYVLLINALTAVLAWYAFSEISGDPDAGLFGSALYSLSMWRLTDLYIRAAAGEYTAMAFLPLIALGFFLLLSGGSRGEDGERAARKKAFLCLVIGYTGLLQTHLLSSIMVSVFAFLFCAVFIRNLLQGRRWCTLFTAAAATVILNLGFLVPFADYYLSHDLMVEHQNSMIQAEGAWPAQIFSVRGDMTAGAVPLTESFAMSGEMPLGLGLPLLLVLFAVFSLLLSDTGRELRKKLLSLGLFSLLALWMSTCYFPYDRLVLSVPPLSRLLNRVQYPWRYLTIATILLSLCAVLIAAKLRKDSSARRSSAFIVSLAILCVWSAVSFISERNATNSYIIRPMNVDQISAPLIDNDSMYRFQGSDVDRLRDQITRVSDDSVTLRDVQRKRTKFSLSVINSAGKEGWVELPLQNYRGYHAKGADGALPVTTGDDFRVRVTLPAGFDGTVTVGFSEPVLWRAAEFCSLTGWILLLIMVLRNRSQKTGTENPRPSDNPPDPAA
ncbi:MAG: hypothetical protein K6G16_07775 [Lachnospiraceae bacterium]|nr:hypothetical protein [Lachnospiraceae bacterium]